MRAAEVGQPRQVAVELALETEFDDREVLEPARHSSNAASGNGSRISGRNARYSGWRGSHSRSMPYWLPQATIPRFASGAPEQAHPVARLARRSRRAWRSASCSCGGATAPSAVGLPSSVCSMPAARYWPSPVPGTRNAPTPCSHVDDLEALRRVARVPRRAAAARSSTRRHRIVHLGALRDVRVRQDEHRQLVRLGDAERLVRHLVRVDDVEHAHDHAREVAVAGEHRVPQVATARCATACRSPGRRAGSRR